MLKTVNFKIYGVATVLIACVFLCCKNTSMQNTSMATVVPKGVEPSVTIEGRYIVNLLFTDYPVNEYVLYTAKTEDMYGNIAVFEPNGTLTSAYGAECGNDCFTSTKGRYAWKDEKHIRIVVDSISLTGDCLKRDSAPHKDLGIYFVVKRNDKLRLIKSDGDINKDEQLLVWSDAIDAFDDQTKNAYNFFPIHMMPGDPSDTDAETVQRALIGRGDFDYSKIKVLYSKVIRSYFKAVLFEYEGSQHIAVSTLHSGYAGIYEPEKWPKKQ